MHIDSMIGFAAAAYAAEKLQSMGYDEITIGTVDSDPFIRGRDSECGWSVTFRPLTPSRRKGWNVEGWKWVETRSDESELSAHIHPDADGIQAIIDAFDHYHA